MTNRKTFEYRSRIKASAQDVLSWHWRPGSMKKLIPPWENVTIVKPADSPRNGERAILRLHVGLAYFDWVAEHCDFIEGYQFSDKQIRGPFAYWLHVHTFSPIGESECELIDQVEYELPVSPVSSLFMSDWVEQKLVRMFCFRHEVTKRECERVS